MAITIDDIFSDSEYVLVDSSWAKEFESEDAHQRIKRAGVVSQTRVPDLQASIKGFSDYCEFLKNPKVKVTPLVLGEAQVWFHNVKSIYGKKTENSKTAIDKMHLQNYPDRVERLQLISNYVAWLKRIKNTMQDHSIHTYDQNGAEVHPNLTFMGTEYIVAAANSCADRDYVQISNRTKSVIKGDTIISADEQLVAGAIFFSAVNGIPTSIVTCDADISRIFRQTVDAVLDLGGDEGLAIIERMRNVPARVYFRSPEGFIYKDFDSQKIKREPSVRYVRAQTGTEDIKQALSLVLAA